MYILICSTPFIKVKKQFKNPPFFFVWSLNKDVQFWYYFKWFLFFCETLLLLTITRICHTHCGQMILKLVLKNYKKARNKKIKKFGIQIKIKIFLLEITWFRKVHRQICLQEYRRDKWFGKSTTKKILK